jgi:cytochrome b
LIPAAHVFCPDFQLDFIFTCYRNGQHLEEGKNMNASNKIKVWDPLVRVFHWTLASAFFIAYITEEDYIVLHTWAGYIVAGLVLFRILWGMVGTRYARFSSFVFSPGKVSKYLKETLQLRAKRYLGHNPAGGAMIILLLVSLLLTAISGMAVYAAEDNAGPLAVWLGTVGHSWEEGFEEVHEFFANFTMLLVLFHVAGVIVESLLHKENLVLSMFNGYKRAESTELSQEKLP